MVRLIGHFQESLCNKYLMLTLNAGKVDRLVSRPTAREIAVPTLRQVMEHRHHSEVIGDTLPVRGLRMNEVDAVCES